MIIDHDQDQPLATATLSWTFAVTQRVDFVGRKVTEGAGGGSSSHSVISNVRNFSVAKATFNVTQAQNMNHEHLPIDDPRRVLDWLSPIKDGTIQNDTLSKHTKGTGKWFIRHHKFKAWLSPEGTIQVPVLCVRGPLGAGKTILSSIAIHHLETAISIKRGEAAIVFAYCRYTDQLSITDILASFVKQLVKRHSRFFSSVESVYRNHLADGTRPIKLDWLELLQTLIPSFDRLYIVIDALDEFPDDARDGLLNTLLSLQASLLITSRSSNAFHLLRKVEYIEIGDENGQDIERFIHQKFEESSNLVRLLGEKVQIRRQICEHLKEMSKSMFLVAALQIESLKNSTTVNQLLNSANLLSPDIDDMYLASWERIKAQATEQALLAEAAIIWLTHAYRPLKITELQHALAIECGGEFFDNNDLADEEAIVSACCGLVTIERVSRIVRLVHFTALNFFKGLGHSLCSTPHTLLSTRCLSYLSASKFSSYKISTKETLEAFLRDEAHPLRDYAYHHWGSHAARCYEEDGMPSAVSEFLLRGEYFPYLIEGGRFDLFERCHVAVYYGIVDQSVLSNGWWNRPTLLAKYAPLILACVRGSVDMVKLILHHLDVKNRYEETSLGHMASSGSQMCIAVNAQAEGGFTALMVASQNGHVAVVRLLSQTDVAINMQSKEGSTALTLASQNGHVAVVDVLLSQRYIAVNAETEGGFTALMVASQNGHVAVVRLLLSQIDVAINARSKEGSTALTLASRKGRVAVVDVLLSQMDTALNVQTEGGFTALMGASQNGHVAVVRLLLSQPDIAINIRSKEGSTALTLASQNGHVAVVDVLLSQRYIAVNAETEGGFTALMVASQNGHVAVVKLLLSQPDVTINIRSKVGSTALTLASQNSHVTVVEVLLSKTNIAVNAQTTSGFTALMLASHKGRVEVVRRLLSQTSISVNTQSESGVTALTLSSLNGNIAVVELLLSHMDIAVNAQTAGGFTALMAASQNGHVAAVRLLLSQTNIAVNTQSENGATALTLASLNGNGAVVDLLLSHMDISVNARTEGGFTALMLASHNGHVAVVRLLLRQSNIAEEDSTALTLTSWHVHDAVVEVLLSQRYIAVNAQTDGGFTALMLASQNGHLAVVRLLLSQMNIAINTQSKTGVTALTLASLNGHDAVVELLLSQTDIAVNDGGFTALMAASQNGHVAVVRLLLSQTYISINTRAKGGVTALMLASLNGHGAVVDLLLRRSDIAVNTQDEDGATALTLACQNCHNGVIKLLLSYRYSCEHAG